MEGKHWSNPSRKGKAQKDFIICSQRNFDSSERVILLLNAIRGNTFLERLDLHAVDGRDGTIPQTLAASLRDSNGLAHLGLHYWAMDESSWSELLPVIFGHQSRRTIAFLRRWIPGGPDHSSDFTKAVADEFCSSTIKLRRSLNVDTFNRSDWNALVAPRIERNLYRKRFLAIQKINVSSTHAVVVAAALARMESKPSLVCMLLSQNHGIISGLARDDQVPIPS
jgi:hypothetical protein